MWPKNSKLAALIWTMAAGVGFVISLHYTDFDNIKNGVNLVSELQPLVWLISSLNFFWWYIRHLKKEGRFTPP